MSLSTALSLETLTPDELFAASERDLSELWAYYDANGNGLIEFDEFEGLVTEVLNRMAAQLPSQIPARYCLEYGLGLNALQGVEQRIAAKFASVSRAQLARSLFLELDVWETASEEAQQARAEATAASAAGATVVSPTAAAAATSAPAAPAPARTPSPSFADPALAGGPGGSGGSKGVGGARGFLEPCQLKPLHSLMEKHLLNDLYESIGTMMVQKQMSALDRM